MVSVWQKCPPLVLLTRVISILLYVNNVYLHSRAVREERREERGEKRGEERGTGPPLPRTRKLYKRVALAVWTGSQES